MLGKFCKKARLHYPVFDVIPLLLPCDFVLSTKGKGIVRGLGIDNFYLGRSPYELL